VTKDLLFVYCAYILSAGSPGPSTMAIMSIAMREGRRSATALAAGIVVMSFTWGLIAATGLSAILLRYAQLVIVLKVAGGFYLIWLAIRSARSTLDRGGSVTHEPRNRTSRAVLFRRGVLMHLGNPKSVLSWLAIMTLGVGPQASGERVAVAYLGCAMLGIVIFFSYAWLFSTAPMVRGYLRARRWIEGTLAVIFASAGLRLIYYR
jgi:threonine/homoserine/homoserine lactone efflux protein